MSYTTKLNLFKHNEPLDENENPFDIKTALNDNWDILDDYADETDTKIEEKETEIQNLENILPKSTATGEEIYLNNSANYKFNYFNNGGNTHQDSYEGINLLPNVTPQTKTQNGVTIVANNDGSFKITGTPTAEFDIAFDIETVIIPQDKYIHLRNNGTLSSEYGIRIRNNNDNVQYLTFSSENRIYQMNYSGNRTINKIAFTCNSTMVGTAINTTCQLSIEDTNSVTDYEPFVGKIPSPSPSYPQDILNVGSNVNMLTLEDISTGVQDNITITNNGDGSLTLNGTTGNLGEVIYEMDNPITLKANKPYTLSLKYENDNFSNDVGSFILRSGTTNKFNCPFYNYAPSTLTPTTDTIIDHIRFYLPSNRTFNNYKIYPKLEQGSQPTGYTPYNRGGIDVKVENKNLFDKNNANILSATINSSTKIIETSTQYKLLYIPCKPNTTYAISKIQSGYLTVAYSTELPAINVGVKSNINSSDTTKLIYTTGEDANYLVVRYYRNTDTVTEQQILDSIQIEQGSTASTYIAHAEQNITIPLPVGMELCRIGDYSDKIFHNIPSNPMYNANLVEGGWYKYNAIYEKIVNENDSLSRVGSNSNENFSQINMNTDIPVPVVVESYSDYFSYLPTASSATVDKTQAGFCLRNQSLPYIVFSVPASISTTANVFRTWLTTHNVKIKYPLATPTYIQITDTDTLEALNTLENFTTYQGQTNISSDNIPSPIFDVQYFLDLQSLFN